MMRFLVLSVTLSLLLGLSTNCVGQESQDKDIRERLDEIQEMMVEEQNTISLLEAQLVTALDAENEERAEQIRKEIETAHDSLDQMRSLRDQLRDLQEETEEGTRDKRPTVKMGASRRPVPTPSMGGLDGVKRKDETNSRPNRSGDRTRNSNRSSRSNENRGGPESAKWGYLRDAFDALTDAGELVLAEEVDKAIHAERRRLDRAARSSERERKRRRATGNRSRGGGDGATRADEPSSRKGRNDDRKSSGDDASEMDDLEDEIDRLREQLERMRDRKGKGDGNR